MKIRIRSLLLLVTSFFFPVVSGACKPVSLPGTSEGTFSVVGTLETNTCGSGIGASNPWDFALDMSEDGTTLYLAQTDGSSEISGTLSATTADLTSTVTSNVDGTEAGVGPCDLTLVTTFDIDLNSASSPTSFTGTASYAYTAATGVSSAVDCSDQLTSSGGSYSTLPCSVTYSLAATRQ